ncbi:MAG: methyltransferase domain-containing protein [Verrucomicrobiota bacterium]|nr:methyltransferase domain-containing protein [Verrucomicrobiota bacterium]MDY5596294.1 methyltransferase domain-containing protein [Kiritimatiellia bacterium]
MMTDSTATARRFARHFATYPDEAVVQRHTAEALVESLRAEASGPCFPHVVELGCGTGLLTRAFLRAFKCEALLLLDIVETCAEFFADLPQTMFRCADLDALEALPPTDLVLSASCLQWLRDPERLFRVVAASLPKCGLFAAATFSAGNLAELEQCGGQPLTCPAAGRWREMLEASGFEIRRFEARTVRLSFQSALEALRHLKRTGVLTPALGGYRDARRFLARYETLRDSHGVPLTYTPVFWVAAKA